MKIGDKVHYIPFEGCSDDQIENGIIKLFNDQSLKPFVVFNCNDDWDNYKNYTGQCVNITQLNKGWYGFTPELFNPFESDDEWYYRFNKPDNGIGYNLRRESVVDVYLGARNNWYIKQLGDDDIDHILYHGKIPNNKFAFYLFQNLGLLTEEDFIRINRELTINNL